MDPLLAQWLASTFAFPDPAGALAIAAKTALIYVFLILGLRLLGQRELGQMSVYDLVLIVVIANSVQNAMIGQDTTLGGGLIAALVLLILNRGFTWLILRHPELKHWLIGEPILIVREGRLLQKAMQREGITQDNILAAMREHGIADLADVQIAVLEVDGTLSIVAKDSDVHRTHRHVRGMRIP
ncbi:MAG: YetF domain-containing protein [Anaerolineae bacterium]